MADLAKCPACGGSVSTKAKACPACGQPAPQRRWPTFLFVAIAGIALGLFIVGRVNEGSERKADERGGVRRGWPLGLLMRA